MVTEAGADGTIAVRAPGDTKWGDVVRALDEMKRAGGDRPFVLVVMEEPAARSREIRFPKASDLGLPPAAPPRDQGRGAPDVAEMRPIEPTVSLRITKDGDLLVNGTPLGPGMLAEGLRAANGGYPNARLIIVADADARFALVVTATREGQDEGMKVAFAVMPDAPVPSSSSKPRMKDIGQCPFPKESDKLGIDEAVVAVRASVDAAGKATRVVIVADPGHGFGEAARVCATKAQYVPARDDKGNAIAGEAVIRVRFVR